MEIYCQTSFHLFLFTLLNGVTRKLKMMYVASYSISNGQRWSRCFGDTHQEERF